MDVIRYFFCGWLKTWSGVYSFHFLVCDSQSKQAQWIMTYSFEAEYQQSNHTTLQLENLTTNLKVQYLVVVLILSIMYLNRHYELNAINGKKYVQLGHNTFYKSSYSENVKMVFRCTNASVIYSRSQVATLPFVLLYTLQHITFIWCFTHANDIRFTWICLRNLEKNNKNMPKGP